MLKRRCTFCSSVNVIITKAAYNRPEYSYWQSTKVRKNRDVVTNRGLINFNRMQVSDIDL